MASLDLIPPFSSGGEEGEPLLRSAVTLPLDDVSEEQLLHCFSPEKESSSRCRVREEEKLQELLISKPSLILITGSSGSGKSSLALKFRDQYDYFCSAKFDQMCLATYMPFGAALSDLTEQLLANLDADQIQRLGETLPNAVDGETGLLLAVIPRLSNIIPAQNTPSIATYNGMEQLVRLRHVVTCFLEFVCHVRGQSVLLFLDDLQWAEPGCMEMLAAIMRRQIPGLQVIAACRSDEVSPESALSKSLRQMEDEGSRIEEIHLRELDVTGVCELVSCCSDLSKGQCQDFSKLLHQHTSGNVYYTLELFRALKSMGAVSEKNGYIFCDMELLESFRNSLAGTAITDVITMKLRELSLDAQKALALASFMGTTFDSRLLSLALNLDEQHFMNSNEINKSSRLVVQVNQTAFYHFHHDKVQQACFSLLSDTETSLLCLEAARTLLDKLEGTDGIEENSALISRLLCHSLHLVDDPVERVKFANLFYLAGKSFLKSSRFNAAAYRFQNARDLLPQRHWRDQYDLSLSIYTASAEVEHVVGHCEHAEKLAKDVIENARSFFDSVVAHTVTICSYSSQLRFEEAIQLGLQLLRKLKVPIPRRAGKLQIAFDVIKTKRKLKKFQTADILSLPIMTRRETQAAMEILAQTFTSAYLSNSPYQVPLSMAMIRLTLDYGMNAESVSGFAMFSVIMAMMSNFELARQYGQLTLDIMQKHDVKAWVSRVYTLVYGLAFTETMPVRMVVEPLMEGYRTGLASGDITSATGSLYLSTLFRFLGWESIDEVFQIGVEYRKVLNSVRHDNVLILFNIALQGMENLLGRNADPVELTGSFINQKETEELTQRQANRAAQSALCMCGIIVAFTMADFARAESIYDFYRTFPSVQSKFSRCCIYFFGGASKLILAHKLTIGRRRRIMQAKKCLKFVRKRAENVPEDHSHQVHFLEALLYDVEGNKQRALAAFDEAAICSERGNSLLHRALIAEHKSRLLQESGTADEALDSLIEARRIYEQWGAKAKTDQLGTYPMLQKPDIPTGMITITGGSVIHNMSGNM